MRQERVSNHHLSSALPGIWLEFIKSPGPNEPAQGSVCDLSDEITILLAANCDAKSDEVR
jgi:hypothetical protein